jgi:hypothetical protein
MGSITIKKSDDIIKIRRKLRGTLKSIKGFNANKYIGKLKLREEPLHYQKRVRKQWNEYTD